MTVTLDPLDFLLETQGVENHDIGAVKDQRQEESKAAEVHVALRIEFARLNFHTLTTSNSSVLEISKSDKGLD